MLVSQPQDIRHKLDHFIRKYYKNRMIKGGILSVALLVTLFLLLSLAEYFGYFGTLFRAILFWLYLAVALAVVGYYVLVPLFHVFRLGKVISYPEAASIIGNFFPEVQDKLLNLLQLQQQDNGINDDLLSAAIQQKITNLSPIPFHNAVNFSANRRYLKFAAIPLAVALALLLLYPALITEPSHRIAHYNTHFDKPAPFVFVIQNSDLHVPQQEDFDLSVSVEGEALPAEVFINVDGSLYKMSQADKSHFSYTFRTVQRSCTFSLQAAGFRSQDYRLQVFPRPSVVDFQILLSYPAYTHRPNETLSNEGDLNVPQGTSVKWLFNTKDVDTLHLILENEVRKFSPDSRGRIAFSLRVMESFPYSFCSANRFAPLSDTLAFSVTAIPDLVPLIAAVELKDSLRSDHIFFQGRIKDDYGFSKLEFVMVQSNQNDTADKKVATTLLPLSSQSSQEFAHAINLSEIALAPGDKLVYFFRVWDNDAIHGPKPATSQQFHIELPSEKELDMTIDRNAVQAQQQVQKSVSQLRKMQQEINELMRQLVDKKELDWQDKKAFQELAKKQKEVKEMLQQMKEQLNENKKLEQLFKEQSESVVEKQKELERLMDELMSDEMKDLMKQMDQLMQEIDKNKVQEELEKMKVDNEQLEKQLDQNLELMKRLEMEKKVEDAVTKADELSKKQKELAEKSAEAKDRPAKEQSLKEQQQLSQQFEELKESIQDIKQGYKEIDKDLDFKTDQKLMDKIDESQQSAESNLQHGRQKDASGNQKQASDDLQKLSEQLAEAQTDLEQQDLAEDAELIRRLLKNLVRLSFNQEELIGDVGKTLIQDPKYQKIIANQNRVKDDFRMVDDSLQAIARRQLNVAKVINKNLGEANAHLARALSGLLQMNQSFYGSYKNQQAAKPMQYTMTSFNNLALVLAESLDQMNNQMRQNQQKKQQGSCKNKSNMKKQGNCTNPGNGKPSAKSMKQMQQELNKQMEALKKQLDKQGKKPDGRKKIGDKGQMQLSKEFARMAAQQEMIRRMMQQYGQEMKQNNAGNSKLAKEIDQMMKQMEQTETDLVNRVISQQTITRQQQIMTRMLEHEKAQMQREKEDRRQSKEGKEQLHQPSPAELEKYEKLKEKNMELFRSIPPTLSPYYKSKVDDYFYKF